MKVFYKYLFGFLSFSILILFYLFVTQLGNQTLRYCLGYYLSSKTGNRLVVEKLEFKNYPKLVLDININRVSNVHLVGRVTKDNLDMDYLLTGKKYRWNSIKISSPINLKGHLKGEFSALDITGDGLVFDGRSSYHFVKMGNRYKNINVLLTNVKSEEVLKFLKQKPLLKGRANIKSEFTTFAKYEKRGSSHIYMRRGFISTVAPDIPFQLDATINFENVVYRVDGEIKSKVGTLTLKDAIYNKSREIGEGSYRLNIKELSYFEHFLKHQYHGELDTSGKIIYRDKNISIKGITNTFEGLLSYRYNNRSLNLNLDGVSLVKILQQSNYPALLSAKVYGDIDYNIKDRIVLINTELKEARFRETKMTNMIYRATGIDMLADIYNNSSFVAGYQNSRLSAILKIDNGRNHIYLNDAVLNSKTNSIDSKFDVKIEGEEIFGDIYGTLEHPRVSIDMKRLFKYQLEKNLGDFLGNNKIKEVKKIGQEMKREFKTIELNDIKSRASSFFSNFLD